MADVTNVSSAKPATGGAIYMYPLTATMPTDATSERPTGGECLGYVTDEGLRHSMSMESETTKAWGGDTIATNNKGKTNKFTFGLAELLNVAVLKLIHGSNNVTGTLATGITVTGNNDELDNKAFIVDMVLNDNAVERIVIPVGKVDALGDIQYVDGEVASCDVTIAGQSDKDGNSFYQYIKRIGA